MKLRSLLVMIFAALSLAVGGCGGPQLSDAEIGKPIFTLPELPGANEPYPMPELDQPADEAAAGKEKAAGKEALDAGELQATER